MKKQLFTLVALGLLLTAVSGYAQTIRMRADVPFDFMVSGNSLPAGEYDIRSMGPERSLYLSNPAHNARLIVVANRCESLQRSPNTKLVFRKYGDRYFLAQVWVEGDKAGHEFAKSRLETELARNLAKQDVTVAASLK